MAKTCEYANFKLYIKMAQVNVEKIESFRALGTF